MHAQWVPWGRFIDTFVLVAMAEASAALLDTGVPGATTGDAGLPSAHAILPPQTMSTGFAGVVLREYMRAGEEVDIVPGGALRVNKRCSQWSYVHVLWAVSDLRSCTNHVQHTKEGMATKNVSSDASNDRVAIRTAPSLRYLCAEQ